MTEIPARPPMLILGKALADGKFTPVFNDRFKSIFIPNPERTLYGNPKGCGFWKRDKDLSTDRNGDMMPRVLNIGLENKTFLHLHIVADRIADIISKTDPTLQVIEVFLLNRVLTNSNGFGSDAHHTSIILLEPFINKYSGQLTQFCLKENPIPSFPDL